MVVDRGGLRYTIAIRDNFSAQIQAFRTQIKGAQKDFASFKTGLAAQTTATARAGAAAKGRARSLSVESTAQKELNRELEREVINREKARLAQAQGLVTTKAGVRAAGQLTTTERKLLAVREKAERQQRSILRTQRLAVSEQDRLRRAEERRIATVRRLNDAQRSQFSRFQQTTQVQNANTIATGEQAAAQRQYATAVDDTGKAVTKTTARTKQLNKTGKATQGTFQSLFFTFRRLVGVFAAFAIARAIIAGFRALVGQSVSFNAQLEQAQLGIAAIITAGGDVRDAMGGAASSARQFALAQVEARKQVQQLRKDALSTNATFEQLLETFQIAIGPGLAAGVDLDEIRKLTIRISQAATAIGLPQNQLAEEIRSILSGTIQLRTTRLAAVLGITNEDVRRARELGILTEFLGEKFEAFGIAGEESLKNFNVLLVNTQDAIKQVLSAGGLELFDELKALLLDIFRTAGDVDDQLKITGLNPKAVALVKALSTGLKNAVSTARQLASGFGFEGALAIATGIGGAITSFAKVAAIFIEGFVKGFGDAFFIVNAIADTLKTIANLLTFGNADSVLRAVVVESLRLVVAIGTVRLAFIAIVKLVQFAFVQSLGRAVTLIAAFAGKLVVSAKSAGGLLAIFRALTFTPIGAVLTAAAVALGVLASKAGIFSSFFGTAAENVENTADEVERLSKTFDELAGSIFGGLGNLDKFGETTKQLRDDLRDTVAAAQFDILSTGLKGGLRNERKIIADAELEIVKRTVETTRELENTQADILGIQRKRRLEAEALFDKEVLTEARIKGIVDAAENQLEITSKLAAVEADRATTELDLADAKEQGDRAAVAASQLRLQNISDEQLALESAARDARRVTDLNGEFITQLVEQGQLTEEQGDEILDFSKQLIESLGRENSLISKANQLAEARATIEGLINDAVRERLAAAAAQDLVRLVEQNALLEQQVIAQERLNALRAGTFSRQPNSEQAQAVVLQNLIDKQEAEEAFAEARRNAQLAAAKDLVAKQLEGSKAQAIAEARVAVLIRQQGLERRLANAELADTTAELDLVRKKIEQPITTGILVGLEGFAQKAADQFKFGVELMTGILEGFTDVIASSISDAFDPTKDANITERFGRFLQNIANLIIEHLTRLAIAKAALAALGGGAGGAGQAVAAALGFHEGGQVPGGGQPSAAHYRRGVQSFADGGGVGSGGATPPPGVHPKDNVAAWLQKREFVQPVSAVDKYGTRFMEGLRQGAFAASDIQALMQSAKISRVRGARTKGPGYQTGGSVSLPSGLTDAPSTSASGAGVAVVLPSEEAAERLNAGGIAARRRAYSEDKDFLSGLLSRKRR